MTSIVNPEIGAVIIGDELLSGKRQDRHMLHLIRSLAQRGLELAWVRMVGDDASLLTETFRETLRRNAWVFSFGGIGATPDDRTRACLAAALGRPLQRHPEFVALLQARFGDEAYPNRVLMADLPEGSSLIPNPVNGVPGFTCERHFCVPGFPAMAEPMTRWAIERYLAGLAPPERPVERALRLYGVPESRLVPLLTELEQRYPHLRVSSLPGTRDGAPRVELCVRGIPSGVDIAFADLQRALVEGGFVVAADELELLATFHPPGA